MSKKSIRARNEKRKKIVSKYAGKRLELKKAIRRASSYEEMMSFQHQLQALPRNASPTRVRNRCSLTGRPRGYYGKFGLSRNMLRIYAMFGDIPGLVKASW